MFLPKNLNLNLRPLSTIPAQAPQHQSIAQHMHRCTICKHSQKTEINRKIQYLTLNKNDLFQYKISINSILAHARAFNLIPDIENIQKLVFTKLLFEMNNDDATYSFKSDMLEKINKMAKVYGDEKRSGDNTFITIINAMTPEAKQSLLSQAFPDGIPSELLDSTKETRQITCIDQDSTTSDDDDDIEI